MLVQAIDCQRLRTADDAVVGVERHKTIAILADDVEIVLDIVFGLAGKLTMAGGSLLIKPLAAPCEIAR